MTLRDDPETERKIVALVAARAHEDYQRASEMLRELTQEPDDTFLLMLMLTRRAAFLAHEAHHDFAADVRPIIDHLDGTARVAMQLIATMANDDLPTAFDLAKATVAIGGTNPRHTQGVLVNLVDICSAGGPRLMAVPTYSGGQVAADPTLN